MVEAKVFGEVRFVCFCNGSHFKVAVATNDKKWIVHDGLKGWSIGKHGDSDFGKWFQSMDYEIVLVVFEVMTDDNNFMLEGLPSLYTILPNRILTMRRLIMLDMSRLFWKSTYYTTSPVDMDSMWSEATHEFMEKLPESLLENLLEKVDNSEYRAFMEDEWNIVIMNEIKGILKEEESVNENVMKTMTKRGYAVMKVPDELFAAHA